ncbi:MAG: NUDIX hydrolase, partial [Chloroflexota bacterium]
MKNWQTLERRTLLEHSKYLTVESHTIKLPDGRIISDWPWVITPDAVLVVTITTEGEFLCFRQVKYGIEGTSLAPIGGHMDLDEDPLEAAKRELLEETGYQAASWDSLGNYMAAANRGMATRHIFLARDAQKVTEPDSDDLEEQELLFLSRSELESALENGEFKILSWAAAIGLALNFLRNKT